MVWFCLLLLNGANCRTGILSSNFSSLFILFFHFFIHKEWKPIPGCQRYTITCLSPWLQTYVSTAFYSRIFIFFYLWPYILNVQTSIHDSADIFRVTVHVFHNLFWKIGPLFGQILITCLKFSRTSFSPNSYSEKMVGGNIGAAQFPQGLTRFIRNSSETMRFCKISTSRNYIKLWYFMQCCRYLTKWNSHMKYFST